MAKVSVYNMEGKEVGNMDLNDAVFGVEINEHLVHMAVVQQLANNRQGTQKAKTRSEVSGGGRKPWRHIRRLVAERRRLGHTPCLGKIVHEQMLHRRIGQHDAQLGQSVGQPGAKGRTGALAQQHNGPRGARQHGLFFLARLAKRPHVNHALGHHRQGLPVAPLATAQLGHRLGIVGVAH